MEKLTILLEIINIIIPILALCLTTLIHLHMFQLNSYQIKSHFNRIKQNPGQLLPDIIIGAAGLASLFMNTVSALVYTNCLFVLAIILNKPKKAKKPMVYTTRIKRHLTLYIIYFAIIIVLSNIYFGTTGRICAISALYLLSFVSLVITALICKPFEKAIST